MKKIIALLIMISFAAPARAGLVTDFDPVEQNLLESNKALEKQMSEDFKKSEPQPVWTAPKEEKSGSSWWKWTLGIVLLGGIAAAAGGGGGGSSSPAPTQDTGSVTATW